MSGLQAVSLGVGFGLLALVVVVWLKGAFGLVAGVARRFVREAGEPWTLPALAEPVGAVVVVFVAAAFGLARPDLRWARWFYGARRIARARRRYADDAETGRRRAGVPFDPDPPNAGSGNTNSSVQLSIARTPSTSSGSIGCSHSPFPSNLLGANGWAASQGHGSVPSAWRLP